MKHIALTDKNTALLASILRKVDRLSATSPAIKSFLGVEPEDWERLDVIIHAVESAKRAGPDPSPDTQVPHAT